MTDREEIRQLCDDFTGDFYLAIPEPGHDWQTWIVYILEGLEAELCEGKEIPEDHPSEYESFLEAVRDAIQDRLDKGRW